MTKVNFIYHYCIQLHWIAVILLDNLQSNHPHPGSDTVSNRSYIATHQKFKIVTRQAQIIWSKVSNLCNSWFKCKAGAGTYGTGSCLHSPAYESNEYSNAPC